MFYNLDFTGEELNNLFHNALSREQIEEIIEATKKGDSAYEIAVKNGFEGSESDWLTSLIGGSEEHVKEVIDKFLEDNPISETIKSVNGKTGDVILTAGDVNAYEKEELTEKPPLQNSISWKTTDETENHPTLQGWKKIPNFSISSLGVDDRLNVFYRFFNYFQVKDINTGQIIENTDNPTDWGLLLPEDVVDDYQGFTHEIWLNSDVYEGDVSICIHDPEPGLAEDLKWSFYYLNQTSNEYEFSIIFKENIIQPTKDIFLNENIKISKDHIEDALGYLPMNEDNYFQFEYVNSIDLTEEVGPQTIYSDILPTSQSFNISKIIFQTLDGKEMISDGVSWESGGNGWETDEESGLNSWSGYVNFSDDITGFSESRQISIDFNQNNLKIETSNWKEQPNNSGGYIKTIICNENIFYKSFIKDSVLPKLKSMDIETALSYKPLNEEDFSKNNIINTLGYTPLSEKEYLIEKEILSGSNTLKWDGNIDNLLQLDEYFRVSPLTPTITDLSDILESTFVTRDGIECDFSSVTDLSEDENQTTITLEYFGPDEFISSSFLILYEDISDNLKKGIYLWNYVDGYISSITFKNNPIFPAKYLVLKDEYLASTHFGLDARDKIIKNVADPIENTDAVNKHYSDNNYLSKSGGTITSNSLIFDRSNGELGSTSINKANASGDSVFRIRDVSSTGKITVLQLGGEEHAARLAFSKDNGTEDYYFYNLYHEGNKPVYTASEVGATPAGYGLGTASGRSLPGGDCNKAIENGFYQMSGSNTLNCPGELIYGKMIVLCRPSTHITIDQIAFSTCRSARRYSDDGGITWNEWEWDTPPLKNNVEYKTTKRYLDSSIYIKRANKITLVNGTASSPGKATYNLGKNLGLVSIDGFVEKGDYRIPLGAMNFLHSIYYDKSTGLINIETTSSESSGWGMYLTIEYTK